MAGYSPTSGLSTNLPQTAAVYFDKQFVDNLKMTLPYYRVIERRELPAQSGTTHRLYMYAPGLGVGFDSGDIPSDLEPVGWPGENVPVGQTTFSTSQAQEGSVGTGLVPVVLTDSAVIGQYVDYVNVSDYALETAIDPALENLEKEMCYRLAGTISTLIRNQADAAATIDASVDSGSLTAGTAMTIQDPRKACQELRQRSVQPFTDNTFCGVISPLVVGDIITDDGDNGLTAIYKHTETGLDKLLELPGSDGKDDEVQVLDFGGFRFYETPYVTEDTNYQSSGKTSYRTYLFGHQGCIGISLGVKENSQIGDGEWSNMKIWIMKPEGPSPADPARVIGGWTSYNVKFVATLPPDLTMRLRYIDSTSALS
jgi:N4-gp56 family major capsid protein